MIGKQIQAVLADCKAGVSTAPTPSATGTQSGTITPFGTKGSGTASGSSKAQSTSSSGAESMHMAVDHMVWGGFIALGLIIY